MQNKRGYDPADEQWSNLPDPYYTDPIPVVDSDGNPTNQYVDATGKRVTTIGNTDNIVFVTDDNGTRVDLDNQDDYDLVTSGDPFILDDDNTPIPDPNPKPDNDPEPKSDFQTFLEGLLSNSNQPISDSPMSNDFGDTELNDIQMIAMKVKIFDPEQANELWNMSHLPLSQILEYYNFKYEMAIAQNNYKGRHDYVFQKQRSIPGKKNKYRKTHKLQSRYPKRYSYR